MSEAIPQFGEQARRPLIYAHRGNSGFAPENTIVAFEQGLALGADGSECDVHATADGHLVVMHDADVSRTTDGSGPIREKTLAQMRELDAGSWKGTEYAGTKVPLLENIIALHIGRGQLCIEVKDYACGGQVVELIDSMGACEWASIHSFSYDVITQARAQNPRIPTAWIYGAPIEERSDAEVVAMLLDGGIQAISVHGRRLTDELLARCRRAGLGVLVWTVDEAEQVRFLRELRVDAIVSNRPGVALGVCAEDA